MSEKSYFEPCREECAFCFLNYTDILATNPLFNGMEKGVLGGIIKGIHHQVKTYESGEILVPEGGRLERLIIILEGAVVGEMMDFSGNLLEVERITAPNTIATAFLFGEGSQLPVTITAIEPTKVFCIIKEDLLILFGDQKLVLKNYLDIVSARAQFLSRRIKLLSIPGLMGKIAFYLLEQQKRSGEDAFIMPHTQQELANQLGTTRPSVGRIIRQLHDRKIIEANRGVVNILDDRQLWKMLES